MLKLNRNTVIDKVMMRDWTSVHIRGSEWGYPWAWSYGSLLHVY